MPRLLATLLLFAASACNPRPWDASDEQRILRAIAQHPEHPWAGIYTRRFDFLGAERLTLGPDGEFTFHHAGCIQTSDRDGGSWRADGDLLHLEFDGEELADLTFLTISWDDTRFLVPEDRLSHFTSFVERARVGEPLAHVFSRSPADGTVGPVLHGTPDLPDPWHARAAFGIVRVRVVQANEDIDAGTEHKRFFDVLLEGDATSGLWDGQVLKSASSGEWARVEQCGQGTSKAKVAISRTETIAAEDLLDREYSNGPR